VKQHPRRLRHRGDGAPGLERAHFTVGGSYGDQARVRPQRGAHLLRCDATLRINGEERHVEAGLHEVTTGGQHGCVLHGGRHDVASTPAQRHTFDGEVVRLRGATGEDDTLRAAPHEAPDFGARRSQRLAGLLPEGVEGRRIPHPALHERTHHGEDTRIDGSEAGIVEVDPTTGAG